MAYDLFIDIAANSKKVRDEMKSLGVSMTTLGANTRKTTGDFSKGTKDVKKFNNSLKNLNTDATTASRGMVALSKSFQFLKTSFGVAGLYQLMRGFVTVTSAAMDTVETVNLFNVSMGDAALEAEAFVDKMNEAFSLDRTNMMNAVGTFGLLARSMGMSSEQAQVLATNTAKLSVDLASLTNVPIQQVTRDLRSGLVGQSETMYKYGVDVTEAALAQEALRQGISKSVRGMSQGEKMALRYAVMIRQTVLAHGDFAKTIEQPANQIRIMTERVIQLGRTLGSVFIPFITVVMPYINAGLLVLNTLFAKLAALLGYVEPKVKNIDNSFSGYGDSADEATEKIKKLQNASLGIDELNVISQDTGSGADAGGGNILGDVELPSYDNLFDEVTDKTKAMAKTALDVLGRIWDAVSPIVGTLGNIGAGIYEYIIMPLVSFGTGEMAESLLGLLTDAIYFLDEVIKSTLPFFKMFYDDYLVPLGNFGGGVFLWFIESLGEGFRILGDWVKENADVFGAFVTALLITIATIGIISLAIGAFSLSIGGIVAIVAAVALVIIANWDKICEFTVKIWDAIVKAVVDAVNWLNVKTMNFILWFSNAWNAFWTGVFVFFSNIGRDIVQFFVDFTMWIINGCINFGATFTENWTKIWKGVANFFIGIWNAMLGGFETVVNFIIDGLNDLIDKINDFIGLGSDLLSAIGLDVDFKVSRVDRIKLERAPLLAKGGSLTSGQAFIAGELGKAEAIGSYNGKTTVMPLENTDFVQAMYEAVKSAVGEGGGQTIENVLVVDGEVLYRSTEKAKSKKGYPITKGVGSLV